MTELSISSFTPDGFGLAHGENGSIEVPFTMPGDRVLVSKGRRGKARLEQLLTPAPDRVPARCVHFGLCGGCRWQHVPYPTQLSLKEVRVHETFGPLLGPNTRVLPILPCEPPWEYRNKMEFSFSSDAKRERYLGLVAQGTRGHVFHLTECHLVDPWMSSAVKIVRKWWLESQLDAYHPATNRGSLRTLILRQGVRTGDRMVMLTVSGNPEYAIRKSDLVAFTHRLVEGLTPEQSGAHLSLFLRIQQIAKKRPTQFYEVLLHGRDHIREHLIVNPFVDLAPRSLLFRIAPSAFFQPNPYQAERLYSRALQLLQLNEETVVYDLYCGTGTLGIAASPYVKQVIGIELSQEALIDARENGAANGCSNLIFHVGDVGQVLTALQASECRLPRIVMVDPPRAGLTDEALHQILQLAPQQILYISCNPKSQSADVARLCAEYELSALQPIDQFPQTIHTENIALLTRK